MHAHLRFPSVPMITRCGEVRRGPEPARSAAKPTILVKFCTAEHLLYRSRERGGSAVAGDRAVWRGARWGRRVTCSLPRATIRSCAVGSSSPPTGSMWICVGRRARCVCGPWADLLPRGHSGSLFLLRPRCLPVGPDLLHVRYVRVNRWPGAVKATHLRSSSRCRFVRVFYPRFMA